MLYFRLLPFTPPTSTIIEPKGLHWLLSLSAVWLRLSASLAANSQTNRYQILKDIILIFAFYFQLFQFHDILDIVVSDKNKRTSDYAEAAFSALMPYYRGKRFVSLVDRIRKKYFVEVGLLMSGL